MVIALSLLGFIARNLHLFLARLFYFYLCSKGNKTGLNILSPWIDESTPRAEHNPVREIRQWLSCWLCSWAPCHRGPTGSQLILDTRRHCGHARRAHIPHDLHCPDNIGLFRVDGSPDHMSPGEQSLIFAVFTDSSVTQCFCWSCSKCTEEFCWRRNASATTGGHLCSPRVSIAVSSWPTTSQTTAIASSWQVSSPVENWHNNVAYSFCSVKAPLFTRCSNSGSGFSIALSHVHRTSGLFQSCAGVDPLLLPSSGCVRLTFKTSTAAKLTFLHTPLKFTFKMPLKLFFSCRVNLTHILKKN